jgi:hypothetical protein
MAVSFDLAREDHAMDYEDIQMERHQRKDSASARAATADAYAASAWAKIGFTGSSVNG